MERVVLNMVPAACLTRCHASQYDIGRQVRFDLKNGADAFVLTGAETVKVKIRRADGVVVENAVPNTSDNYVIWTSQEGECDAAGVAECELRITNGDEVLGSANYIMEVEADAFNGKITTDTAIGNPCTFETDITDTLVSLSADIVATQASGTPTPSNPLPISGISSLEIVRCGVNLLDSTKIVPFNANCTVTKTDNLITVVNNNGYAINFFTGVDVLLGAGTYRLSIKENATLQIGIYKKVGGMYQYLADGITIGSRTATFTLTQTEIIRPQCNVGANSYYSIDEIQITQGATELPFEDYNGQTFTIDLGGTRYGGVYTADGKLRVTHALEYLKDKDWNNYEASGQQIFRCKAETIKPAESRSDIICDRFVLVAPTGNPMTSGQMRNYYFNVYNLEFYVDTITTMADWTDFITTNNVAIKVPLATPIEIDVSSISVMAVSGVNNISSNGGGDVEVKYIKKA